LSRVQVAKTHHFTGGLLIDNDGSLTLSGSQFDVPAGASFIIGASGAGSMEADQGSQITVTEGVSTQIGAGPSGTGQLILDTATFKSNDRVSVGDGGTGSLVFRNGGTLSAGLPASRPASDVALLLASDSTVHFDVSRSTTIDVHGPATLLGRLEFEQSASFRSGTFLPALRATDTNIPKLSWQPNPYLRLVSSSLQQFTAIDMAGNPIGHLSFALPNNTAGPVLIPTVCPGSSKGCAQGDGIFIGAVATNGTPVLKTLLYSSPPAGGGIKLPDLSACQGGNSAAFSIIAGAETQTGEPISMGVAAAALGFDHFNFIQVVTTDTRARDLMTMAGTPPIVPYYDPPPGGWNNL
jgi:hypothetical protein